MPVEARNPSTPKDINEYIASYPKRVQEVLEEIRVAIKEKEFICR